MSWLVGKLRTPYALLIYFASLSSFGAFTANAQIICKENADCDEGLICKSNVCSEAEDDVNQIRNPFVTGCLRTMAERDGRNINEFKMRLCNSDDSKHGSHCLKPEFDYLETRIAPFNWETGMAYDAPPLFLSHPYCEHGGISSNLFHFT